MLVPDLAPNLEKIEITEPVGLSTDYPRPLQPVKLTDLDDPPHKNWVEKAVEKAKDEAATVIQKYYKGFSTRRKLFNFDLGRSLFKKARLFGDPASE